MDVSMEVDENGDQTGAEEGTNDKGYVFTCTLVVTRDLNSSQSLDSVRLKIAEFL